MGYDTNFSPLGGSIEASEITDGTITASKLAAAVTGLLGGGGNIFFLALKPTGVIQGTFNVYQEAAHFAQIQMLNDGSGYAINDGLYWNVLLAAGTYTLNIACQKDINRGIYTVSLDGTTIATLDAYAAGTTQATLTQTGIVVAAAGLYQLRIIAASKNGSSAAYGIDLSAIHLVKTA